MNEESHMDGLEKAEKEIVKKAAEPVKKAPPKPAEEETPNYHMPPMPKEIKVEGSKDPQLAEMLNEIIKYLQWLGKHHRKEENFLCECGKYYSPTKEACPNCFPTGPNAKKK
jgi:hypothetical protein